MPNDYSTGKGKSAVVVDEVKTRELKPKLDIGRLKPSSRQELWWKCSEGHSFPARVCTFVKKPSCRICRSLGYLRPDLASEFKRCLQGDYTPETLTIGSSRNCLWTCSVCGRDFEAKPYERTGKRNRGCPYCSGRRVTPEKSLAALRPDLAAQWSEKNDLKPDEVGLGSDKEVYWCCSRGHEWNDKIRARTRSSKALCPYCDKHRLLQGFNDLATERPDIAELWDYDANNNLKPEEVTCYYTQDVYWVCRRHADHRFPRSVQNMVKSNGSCPICDNRVVKAGFNDLKSQYPEVAAEWDYDNNGGVKPEEVVFGSGMHASWICKCGNKWKTQVYNRTIKGHGCSKCGNHGTSFPEQALFFYLDKAFGDKYVVENRYKLRKKREVDVWVQSRIDGGNDCGIAVEYNGYYYHRSKEQLKRDLVKEEELSSEGIPIFWVCQLEPRNALKQYVVTLSLKDNSGIELSTLDEAIKYIILEIAKMIGEGNVDVDVDINQDSKAIQERLMTSKGERSLIANYPEYVSKYWCYEQNEYGPDCYTAHTGDKVFWKCEQGHVFKEAISNMVRDPTRSHCPVCANKKVLKGFNDLASQYPDIASQWDSEKNGDMRPDQIVYTYGRQVWWNCGTPGHKSWPATVYQRTHKNTGCPTCAGQRAAEGEDLASQYPELFLDEKNGLFGGFCGRDSGIGPAQRAKTTIWN